MRRSDAPKASPNGAGVYVITNSINGKRYVGSTNDFNERWGNHVCLLTYSKHVNKHLERAWHKYGASNFTFTIIEYTIGTRDERTAREQHYLDTWHPEYNQSPRAGSTQGYRFTPEQRANISRALSNRPPERLVNVREAARNRSEGWRDKVRAAMRTPEMRDMLRRRMLGKPKSPDQVEKHRIAITGRKPSAQELANAQAHRDRLKAEGKEYMSPEGKHRHSIAQHRRLERLRAKKLLDGFCFSDQGMANIRAAQARRRARERAEGFVVSEETRRKISEAGMGRTPPPRSEQWRRLQSEDKRRYFAQPGMRERISESLKGKHPSEETRKKLSEAHKGIKHPPRSDEWRKKQSEAQAQRHALKRAEKEQQNDPADDQQSLWDQLE